MHSDIQALWYEAEDHYLQAQEIKLFKHHIDSLGRRLETYKHLRDREIDIFQPVADRLSETFPEVQEALLTRALKHWIATMRYCAMAMLLNNPEFLQHRLLEWLSPQVEAYQLEEIEGNLYEFLEISLQQLLSQEQLALLEPFLSQAQTTLLRSSITAEVGE
jgi:hypothetical protein